MAPGLHTDSDSNTECILTFPDTLAGWPWPRMVNPFYEEARDESFAWIRSLSDLGLSPKVLKAVEYCDPNFLVALMFPLETKEITRIICDVTNHIFLFDETTDFSLLEEAQSVADAIVDGMCNPDTPRPVGESPLGEGARQLIKTMTDRAGKKFIASYSEYLASVVYEAKGRSKVRKPIETVAGYLELRRNNIALKPLYVFVHDALELPDEFYDDPIVQKITRDSVDMVLIGNDVYSYNVEQARGDGETNFVTMVMRQEKLGPAEALVWTGEYYNKIKEEFLNDMKRIPSFGAQHDDAVRLYIDSLGNAVTGNDCWCFETRRYFGTKGLEVQKTRKVALLPSVKRE